MSGSNVGAKAICAVVDTDGTALPCIATDNEDGTCTLKIDTELTANIDPTGLATSANQILSYKGKDRSTTSAAAEELTIPSGGKRVLISCAPSSQAYIEINGDATTSSPLYLEDPFGPIVLDLGSVTKLSVYVVAGNVGAVFFG
jgi:hypothetical protein